MTDFGEDFDLSDIIGTATDSVWRSQAMPLHSSVVAGMDR